ncbi:MAG: TagF domain-containing protein [Propionivibrio sp.]
MPAATRCSENCLIARISFGFNANHPVVAEFDGMVQRSMEMLSGGISPDSGAKSGTVDFQYVSRDKRYIMVGVLTPSKDQAGRLYPLIAASIIPYGDVVDHLPVLPIAFEVFFDGLREQVANAVENSVEALSCRQFLEAGLRTYTSGHDDFRLAESVVEHFMSQQTVSRMASLLSGAVPSAIFQQALLNIAFYQAYLRRFDNRATNQLVSLPLSDSKGEQALLASAWQSILSSLWGGDDPAVPWGCSSMILRHSDPSAQLVVGVGRLPDSFGLVMLGDTIDPSMLLDLSVEQDAWTSHRMYAEVSYAVGRLLADTNCRLSELRRFLADMSRQLVSGV